MVSSENYLRLTSLLRPTNKLYAPANSVMLGPSAPRNLFGVRALNK